MNKALPMAKLLELLMCGSSLNKMKKHQEAFKIFKLNYDKNPKEVYACLGMMMHYFLSNKKEALKFGELGRELAKDAL